YDTLGRRIEVDDADLGLWRYSYDANSNITKRVDAKNQAIFYRFDPLDRITQKDYGIQKPQGDGDVVFTYDRKSDFGQGRLTAVHDSTGFSSFKYDEMGRVTEADQTIGDLIYSTKTSYDKLGRILALTYPNGKEARYEYDGPFLAKVKDGVDG